MPFSARFRVLPLCAAPISGRCVVISSLHTLRTSLGTVRPYRSVPDAVSVPVLASASRASGTFTPRRCRRGPRCARTRSEGRRQGRVQHIVPRINSDPGCSTPAARRNEVRLAHRRSQTAAREAHKRASGTLCCQRREEVLGVDENHSCGKARPSKKVKCGSRAQGTAGAPRASQCYQRVNGDCLERLGSFGNRPPRLK